MDLRLLYQAEFESLVFSSGPKSILDVGCGEGAFLRRAAERNIIAVGIDPDVNLVKAAAAEGLTVRQARADVLPFDNNSFDCMVCERSAHHFPDLAAGLREGLRVARLGLFIFDPWFDESIASQVLAAEFDRWVKRLDTLQGHVNRGPLTTLDFISALRDINNIDVEITHRLIVRSASLDQILSHANAQIEGLVDVEPYRRELDELVARSQQNDLSEAGAIFVCARHVSTPGMSNRT
ncbi:MAG TPA: methyltransferase domain-containing protein [Rhizomicrobium sp.]|jgi:SAM-dependent methyltransferase